MLVNPYARVAVFLVTFIFLFTSLLSAEYKWGKVLDEDWQIEAPEDYPDANAVIIFDVGKYEIRRDVIEIYHHMRIKILKEAGIEEVGEREIVFHDELDKLKKFDAHVITPDGKKTKVEKDAIFEKTSGNLKTRTFAFPQLTPGSIVEYKYNIRSKRYRYIKP